MDRTEVKRWKKIAEQVRKKAHGDPYASMLLFGELTRNIFAEDSFIRTRAATLLSEYIIARDSADAKAADNRQAIGDDFRQLIDSADALLSSGALDQNPHDDAIMSRIDRVFFKTKSFYFAFAIMAITATLLGLISFGTGWITFTAGQKITDARRELVELEKAIATTTEQMRHELSLIRLEKQEEIAAHVQLIKHQIDADAAEPAKEGITAYKDRIFNDLDGIKTLHLGQIEDAGRSTTETFNSEASETLSKALADAVADIKIERESSVGQIDQLAEEAARRIDEIVDRVERYSTEFKTEIEARLTDWEARASEASTAIDRAKGQVGEMEGTVQDLGYRVDRLSDGAQQALEVAARLEGATATGRLDLIGETLGQAALAVWVAVVLAVTSIVVGSLALYRSKSYAAKAKHALGQ